jgi:hypothetical protein
LAQQDIQYKLLIASAVVRGSRIATLHLGGTDQKLKSAIIVVWLIKNIQLTSLVFCTLIM